MFKLRPYQKSMVQQIGQSWETGHRNVAAILPTGGGKTVVLSHIVEAHQGAACVIAHRQELTSQISLSLARNGVHHRIVAPSSVIRQIVKLHMHVLGRSFFNPSSQVAVAGVDTLIRRGAQLGDWMKSVGLWVIDECHHVVRGNKWGKAVEMFPNARGLGVTATPCRTDGKGLGSHADGVFDTMIVGPPMRQLIDTGSLTEYRIFAPPGDLDLSSVKTSGSTGDFVAGQLREAVAKSHIVGDVLKTYRSKFNGMLAVVFVPSVAMAEQMEEEFTAAGVAARALDGKTPDLERMNTVQQFARRELTVLINVALFDEGTDIPALEVVMDAYPTQSYGRFSQRFGRMLRLADGKTHGIYCDHAGNVMRHGLPDAPRQWSLDARERRGSGPSDAAVVKTCPECTAVFERFRKGCPFCGHVPVPAERSGPEQVDGDLTELDPAVLAKMRAEVVDTNEDTEVATQRYSEELARKKCPNIGHIANVKRFKARHIATKSAQLELRERMAVWGGEQRSAGLVDEEIYRKFYISYGVDWLSALALTAVEAEQLLERIA